MPSRTTMLATLGIGPWTPTDDLVAVLESIPQCPTAPLTPTQRVAIQEAARRLLERARDGDFSDNEIRACYESHCQPA